MARGTRRDLKKEAFGRRVVRGPVGSGLSIRAWCRNHGAHESAFYWWRARLAQRDAAAPPFVPVRVTAESSPVAPAGRIEIVLAGERRVLVVGSVDRQTLADVLAVLAAPACPAEAPGC
jgi:transposase-like protein